jgi:hypothetical protein
MIGVGISAGLSGAKRPRSIQDPLPALDLDWATDRSLPAAYGPTPSFSRASTGTYFTSSGVVTTAAVNAPRFDHIYNGSSWVSKGLLVEEQRTNDLTYSRDFSNAVWLKLQALDTVTPNAADGPFGTLSSTKITPSTTNAYHGLSRGTISFSGNRALSVYAKAGGYDFFGLEIKDNFRAVISLVDGTVSSNQLTSSSISILDVGNGWWRITYLYSSTIDRCVLYPLPTSSFGAFAGSGASGILIDQVQIETGSFATSPIPTTTATVTRSADVCQITGTDFSGFWNEPAGALVAEGDTPASGTRSLVSANNATANESSVLRTVGTDPQFVVTDGGVEQASIDAGTVSSSTAFKLAAAYTVNDFAVSKDGAAVVTDTSGTIPTPTQITIGTDAAGNYLCGHIARLRYYNSRLTNSKLQELST